MKKYLPFFLLAAFLLVPQTAYAGLSEGCFPIVQCDAGDDFYGNSCQLHIETLTGAADSCESVYGAPAVDKSYAFSCSAGCYQKSGGGGSINPCPGGILVSGQCLIELNVLSDHVPVTGGVAYKIWDGADLTEIVHLNTAGCTDNQIPVSDSTQPTGWRCADNPTYLKDAVDGVIDFLGILMTELEVDSTNITNIVTALTNLANGGTPAQMIQYKTDLATALGIFEIPSMDYFGVYVGKTAGTYDGSQGGYGALQTLCQAVEVDSHVCTAAEIMNTYNYSPGDLPVSGAVWINNGPPAYTMAAPNDCKGWTANTPSVNEQFFGTTWNFDLGRGTGTFCTVAQSFACCK